MSKSSERQTSATGHTETESRDQTARSLKKGEEISLRIEDAAFEGKGIGKIDQIAIFVANTAPGDLVRARIIRKRKKFREAALLEVLESGPSRIEPRCRHARECGGCNWQHVAYEEQLSFKRRHVRDHMHRIGGLTHLDPHPTIPSDRPYHYRNKMEYTFGDRRWLNQQEIQKKDQVEQKHFALGMHAPGRFDRILDLQECHLQDPISFEILDFMRGYALENGIKPYNTHRHTGYLRNLVIRTAAKTDDVMVNLVTRYEHTDTMEAINEALLERFPRITTLINNVNDTRSPTAIGRFEKTWHGEGYITEYIGPWSFRIDANSFFQTNTFMVDTLYDKVAEFAGLTGEELVYDLYCGVGSLSLYLSSQAKKVVGIELIKSAVKKARMNAEHNGVNHVRFVKGDTRDTFSQELIDRHGRPDVLITDPPRAGMHQDVVEQIVDTAPRRVVYVSCNSATMARDLAILSRSYNIEEVQPVDMFPQTYHIETVARLTRKS